MEEEEEEEQYQRWRNIQNICGGDSQETAFDGGDGPGAIVLSAPPGRAGGGRK